MQWQHAQDISVGGWPGTCCARSSGGSRHGAFMLHMMTDVSMRPEWVRAVAEGATAVQGQHACGICMEELPGTCFMWPGGCSHAYCQDCTRQLCSLHVAEGGLDNLRCPQPDCKQPFIRQVCTPPDLCCMRRQIWDVVRLEGCVGGS